MKQPQHIPSRDLIRLHPWTLARARSASGYLRQVLSSLREAWLDHAAAAHRIQKLELRHGKANTKLLVELEDQKSNLQSHYLSLIHI